MKPSCKKCHLSVLGQWASVIQHGHSEGWSRGRRIGGSRSPLERKRKKEESRGWAAKGEVKR